MFIQSCRLARQQSQIPGKFIWSKVGSCSYTAPLNVTFPRNHFLVSFWVTAFLCSCEWHVPKWLQGKASLLKARKASKNQKEILACALENGCSKYGNAQREHLCRSPVLETLPCNFIKTGFHHWYFPKNVPTIFSQATSQNISKRSERVIEKGVNLFSQDKSLLLLQSNCRSYCNCFSEYW